MKYLNFCLVVFGCFLSSSLFAQKQRQVEADLQKSFNKIGYWEEHRFDTTSNISADDSINKANRIFETKLKRYTSKYPITLRQQFKSGSGLVISTSSDTMLRVYSWDDGTGGTLRRYNSVIQFKGAQKVHSIVDRDGALYIKVYCLKNNGKTYYLAVYFIQAMSSYFGQGIEVWTVENDKLNRNVELFKTSSGMKSQIDYAYWYHDKFEGHLKYNEKTNTLDIPATTKDQKLTGKRILYKFTGRYFERVKN